MATEASEWIRLAEVALAGGLGYVVKAAWDWWARRSDAKTPQASATFHLSHTGQQVDLLARVNVELEQDVERLRSVLREVEDTARSNELAWQARETAWVQERRQMQVQLDQMHAQVRGLMDEIETLQTRWGQIDRRDKPEVH